MLRLGWVRKGCEVVELGSWGFLKFLDDLCLGGLLCQNLCKIYCILVISLVLTFIFI
ncbi:unnamed protein product [Moneuplotes crassus]|uniref:Uncharacterized protein n=1 Tax=Euplotes crassus TaxID=5936 RepID=A0AAD1UNS4_EUPCR|nr:unnamed protein product [Moneuplotes crassus]